MATALPGRTSRRTYSFVSTGLPAHWPGDAPRRPAPPSRPWRPGPRCADRGVHRLGHRARPRAVSPPGGGHPRAAVGVERDPGHAHRLGEVAGGAGRPRPFGRRRRPILVHRAGEGAGVGEVLRPVPRAGSRERGADDRRLGGEPRRAGHLLHHRDPRPRGAARRSRGRRRDRGARRVPLLRRPRPWLGVAGAAARASPVVVPAAVGHARRRAVLPRGPHPPHRPADGTGRRGRAAGASAVRVPAHPPPPHGRGPAGPRRRPAVPGELLPEGRRGPGHGHGQRHQARRRGQGGRLGRAGRRQAARRLRARPGPPAPQRRGRAPRRDAPPLPPPGRAAHPAGGAQGGVGHRHARCGREPAHPHGRAHPPLQVRRHREPVADRPRVPPDRRARRTGRLRHRRTGRGAGPRPRGRERVGRGQGRGRPEEEAQAEEVAAAPRASSTTTRTPSTSSSRPRPSPSSRRSR